MKTKCITLFVALAIAIPPGLVAEADPAGRELTRDEQIDALKTEIELRKLAVAEVRDAITQLQSGRTFDRVVITLSALATVGVWFIPRVSFFEKTLLTVLNMTGISAMSYTLNKNRNDVDAMKEQLAVAQLYINNEGEQLSLLLHTPGYSLSRDEQVNTLNASIQLRQATITDLEKRISKNAHLGLMDVAVITGSIAAGAAVWLIPPAQVSLLAKQIVTFASWLYAISRTATVVVAKSQVPVLREQLEKARDFMVRDERRLTEISGIGTLAR